MDPEEKNNDEPDPLPLVNRETVSTPAKTMSKFYAKESLIGRRAQTIRVPNEDQSGSLFRFTSRNELDTERPNYAKESLLISDHDIMRHQQDDHDVRSREPSFSKFKIPYEMICAQRYKDSRKAYEAQLEHEIEQNVDFQRTAADACYFMRCISYTTFWPPLHNMSEVKRANNNFFQLTEKERWRLQNIMDTDFT
ncbi:uncharacterized protein LOC135436095 [Drosophila montana]|uniref:uncharacterized protein LOC135436095 n=1 Tax=Drosophila montana TaxID=40370 RepID=UPI00313A8F17